MSTLPAHLNRPRLLVEELEPRILYSADAAALLGLMGSAQVAQVREFDAGQSLATAPDAVQDQTAYRREIIFVDSRVPDALSLADQLANRRGAAQFDIVVLQAGEDGIAQINRVLAGETGLAAIHIISHGSDGAIEIGNSWLDSERLSVDGDAVARWGMSLANGGDLLLYGCDVAQEAGGRDFVRELALLTGADVAASSDTSGSSALGANWTLEYATGLIESNFAAETLAAVQWQGTLATVPGTAIFRDTASGATPQTARWDGSSYGATGSSAAAGAWKLMAAAEAPTRNEIIAIGIDNSNSIRAEIWNGSSWSLAPVGGSALVSTYHSFDVAYDHTTGNAMVVWADGGTLNYSVWDGSSWTPRAAIAAYVGADPQEIRLAASPNSSEMVIVISDASRNSQALVWNGSSWGNRQALGATSSSLPVVGVAYEQSSGAAMVIYASGSSADAFYRRWSGGTWGAEQTLAAPVGITSAVHWTEVATDASPGSNRIAVGFVTNTPKTWFAVWDGAAWNAADKLVTPANAVDPTYTTVDVAFEHDSGRLIAAYAQSGSNNVFVNSWTAAGGWSAQQVAGNLGNVPNSIVLEASPNGNDVMLLVQSTTSGTDSHLKGLLWNGSSWAAPVQLTASTNQFKNQPFAFVWDVTPNAAPVVTLPGAPASYTENAAPVLIDAMATVNDVDSPDFDGGTLRIDIVANASSDDLLGIRHQGMGVGQIGVSGSSISFSGSTIGSFSGGAGSTPLLISLTSSAATPAAVQALTRNITFANGSDDPSTAVRSVRFVASDGDGGISAAAGQTIGVISVNDAPAVTTSGAALTYVENQAATVVDADLLVTDVDNGKLDGARVAISGNHALGQDVLSFTNQAGISGSWDPAAGVLTLTGNATLAAYQTALRSITYFNSSDAPSTLPRTVSFTVSDDSVPALSSAAASRTIAVAAVNDAPLLADLAGDFVSYLARSPAIVIDQGAGATVFDIDNAHFNGGSLNVWFASGGIAAQDVLAVRHQGSAAGQIGVAGTTVSYSGTTIGSWTGGSGGSALVVTLNANATSTASAALLRNITYVNAAPSGATAGLRSVRFVLADGSAGGSSVANDVFVNVGHNVRDNFSAASYANNDGSNPWSGSWVDSETDGAAGPDSGFIKVQGESLLMQADIGTTGLNIYRQLNLANASSATLSYSYNSTFAGSSPAVQVQVSRTGGTGYVTLKTFSSANPGSGSDSWDISPYMSADTRIRLIVSGTRSSSQELRIDDVQVAYVLNTAPLLDPTARPTLGAISEDAASPSGAVGTLVSSLVDFASPSGGQDNVVDPDAGAVTGIAVVAADAADGNWWYSINGGTSWSALGTPAAGAARLLAADGLTRLYFQPAADFNGSVDPALDFRAWDQTIGANGDVADSTSNGGSSAFSSAIASASLQVNPVNDAPVLAGSNNLASINRNPTSNPGTLVANLLTGRVSDADAGAQRGIAVYGVDNSSGLWQFSTDGGSVWSGFGMPSAGDARLLAADLSTLVRFVPNTNYSGTVSSGLAFRAWDQTGGAAGGTADATANGGSSAFSSSTAAASIVVTASNTAPLLSGANPLTAINEDATSNNGTLVSSLIAGRSSDADPAPLGGIAVTAVDDSNGSWQWSLDGGGSWSGFANPTVSSALLLAADGDTRVRFVPSAHYNGVMPAAIAFRAWDQTSGTAGASVNTAGPAGNYLDRFSSASYANNDGSLNWTGSWVEVDSNGGGAASGRFSVSGGALAIQVANVNDSFARQADLGGAASARLTLNYTSSLSAGAILHVQASNNGGTSYSTLAGGIFSASSNTGTGSLSLDLSAFAAPDTRIRLLVVGGETGAGKNGLSIDDVQIMATSGNGGSTAFSTAIAASSLTVNAVNDVPLRSSAAPAAIVVNEDSANSTAVSLGLATLAYLPGGGGDEAAQTLSYRVTSIPSTITLWLADGSTPVAINAPLTLAELRGLAYRTVPDASGSGNLSWVVQDDGGVANGGTDTLNQSLVINVSAVNDAPQASNLNAAETYVEDSPLGLKPIVISDIDSATLTATLTLSNPAAGSLNTATAGAVTSNYDTVSGAWKASGTVDDVNALLSALVFTPAPNFNAGFTIATSVSDGVAPPVSGSKAMVGTPVDDAPVITTSNSTKAYPIGAPASAIDPMLVVTDVDSTNLAGATVAIAGGYVNGRDILSFVNQGSITGTWSAALGELRLNGTATVAQYQSALRSVNFQSSSATSGPRLISFQARDASATSAAETRTISVGQEVPALWISSTGDSVTSATTGGLKYNDGQIARLSNPNLTLGAGVSNGTFTGAFDIDPFTADGNSDINGLHYVSSPVLVGTVNPVQLLRGDILLSVTGNETLGGVAVTARDVVLFRPTAAGNYSAGTFSVLLRDSGGTGSNVRDFALVETPMTIGGRSVLAGDLLVLFSGGFYDSDVTLVRPINPATGTASLSLLLDGDLSSGTNFKQKVYGIELVQHDTSFGGASLSQGQLLLTLDNVANVGVNRLSVTAHDVFVFTVTATGEGTSSGTASMLLRGADVGLSSGSEEYDALALVGVYSTAPELDSAALPILMAQDEDAGAPTGAVGTLISSLVDFKLPGGQVDNVTDPDTDAQLGIAVIAADTSVGSWWYSLDSGSNWNALGSVSNTSARLLAADTQTRLYFRPAADFNGTIVDAILFRAWDRSSSSNGALLNTAANGGTTAFSVGFDGADLLINPVNDAPTIIDGASVALAVTDEDTVSGSTTVDSLLNAVGWADIDSAPSKGIAVTGQSASGNWQYSTDGLAWTSVGSVSATHALLLASTDRLRYAPDAANGETASITMRAWDQSSGSRSATGAPSYANPGAGGGSSAFSTQSASASIAVSAINDAPVVTTSAGTLSYLENQSAAAIDPAITVGDVDGATLHSATVRISANHAVGQDLLGFENQNGISGSFDGASGVLTLSGTASIADYQTALRSVSYFNSSDDPSPATRTVSFSVTDGALTGNSSNKDVTVTAVNDEPLLATSGGATAYAENQPATPIDTALTLADPDNTTLTGARVMITANLVAGQDLLRFTDQNGISGSFDAATGVLTLSGASSLANYQAALRSVGYFNSSDDPNDLPRTVSFVVNDGAVNSAVASKTISVTAVNDAPVVSTSAGSIAYVENQAVTPIDGALTLSDLDDATLVSATIRVSSNFAVGQDVLGFTNQNGISGGFDAATGVLTLSGASTVADYQAALRSVSYFNSSDDPSSLARTVSFVVNDGALSSGIATRPINVTAVNDAPVVSTSAGSTAYVENQAALPIDGALTLADLDDATLSGATVTISTNYVAGQDLLGFVDQNGISGSFDAATGMLSLSGSSSVANYQAALRSVSYFNRSDDPSALARTVSFVVSDGALSSSIASKTVGITAVNDAPLIVTGGGATAYVENQTATPIDGALTLSDLDNTTLASATIRVGSNFVAGQDVLGFTNQNGISGSFDAGTGVLTLSGSASTAHYQAALRSVSYFNSSDDPSALARTVSFVVNDGALDSAVASKTIAVAPVNDAPVVATSGGALAYAENQAASPIDAGLTLADLDHAELASATVSLGTTYVNGQDLLGFNSQNGISGSFDAMTGVLTLAGPSSVTNYQTALRSVTYANSSDDPNPLTRIASFVVDDGSSTSAAASRNITLAPTNDAPTVSTSSGTLAYTENQGAIAIDAGLTVADLDNVDLAGATVAIAANYVNGQDLLGFVNQNGISGLWDATTGVLTLSGSASVASYQAALRSVTYLNSSDDPSALARILSFAVSDGAQTSSPASMTVTVSAVNDAPVLTGSNNLGAINRNPTSNPGTRVADLIAGHASDADSPTLGIAVTGVINANGNWQFSTDAGSSWTAFGTPGDATARLLAANAGSFVRFVPNPDWSGTVNGGLTFRAWESSAALAGTAADATASGSATTFSAATASASIMVASANAAPTLSGADNLGPINEDAFGNAGTLVSTLIAGRISDTDPAALAGVAVTAVDNSNGSWQYTVNGGALWSSFGTPSAGSSRLLTADANTSVRFVPNPEWNGSVGNGITFRAWDQTSGVAGGMANVNVGQTMLDKFDAVAYNSNDGSAPWSSNWIDVDASAVGGSYRIVGGQLQIKTNNNTDSIHRGANLSAATAATLSFNYTSDLNMGAGGQVNLRLSNDGGASYTTIATFTSSLRTGSGLFSADISAYASAATRIRFETVGVSSGETLLVDNVQISFGSSGGSESAFSAASAASSITVRAVNDRPVRTAGTPLPITIGEDSANGSAVTLGLAGLSYGPGGGADESGQALSYRIVAVPAYLTLWQADGITPVGTGATLSLTQLQGLAYKSVANGNGSDSLVWTVQDNGGIANGGSDLLTESLAINVVAVNDAPTAASSGGSLTYFENQAATAIDTGLAIADIDNSHLDGATVAISTNYIAGQDVLGFVDQNGIGGAWNAASGVLTLSGSSTVANYQAALRSVSYFNSSDDPSTVSRTVSFVVNDGALSSSVADRTISVTAVNDAPLVATSGGATAHVENQPAKPIDAALTLTDPDHATLAGARVAITANFVAGQDVLRFTDQNGISGSFDAATGVLTLSGASSLANYQAALRSVSYFNSSDDPSALARTVSFVVSDGTLSSSVASKTVNVVAVNDAPVVSTTAGSTAYVENQTATPIDGALTLSDLDDATLASATIRVSSNFVAGQDVLGFKNQNGISGSFDAGSGVLTLSGSASLADYQAALRSVSYFNSSDDPSALPRTVSFVVNDGALDSAAATRSVLVTPVNDAPVLSTSSGSLAYAENQPATAVDPMLSLVDFDNATLVGATVAIATNYAVGQDVLGFTNQNGISGSFDAATGVLTLSGASSLANYQAALRSVGYFNSSDDPSALARTVSFVVSDGALSSGVASRTINVVAVNDAPVVSTTAGSTAYVENQTATPIDGALTLSDLDDATLASATIRVSSNFVAGQDVLGFTNQNGISGSFDAGSGVLTLSGSASLADYQAALRSVSYFNSSDDPSALPRTVSFVVNDGALDSAAATRSVLVTPVNDAPVLSTSSGSLAYAENQLATAVDPMLSLVDLDNATLVGATVAIATNYVAGQDLLGFDDQHGISGSFDAATGVLTLSGSSSVANYQAALRSVGYFNSSDDPSALARTVSFVVGDGTLSSSVASKTVNVVAVNDAPVVSTSAGSTAYVENQAATPIDGALTLSDLDDATLASATIRVSSNFVAGQDVLGFTNQNGIKGSFDATTGVLALSGSASIANYQAALRSVSYMNSSDDPSALPRTVSFAVNDGAVSSSVASKTVSVTAVNDAPVVSTSAGSTIHVENQAATPIDGALTLADLDDATLAGATVTISSNFTAGQDELGFTNQNGISGSFDAGSGRLTLRGSASIADYQAALRSVSYFNSSDDPSALPRTVSFVVNDGTLDSAAATRSVMVTPVNDAPVLSTSSGSLAYAENQPATAVDPMLSLVDLDNATLVGATVAIATNYVAGQDLLGFTNQNGISGSFDAATGVLTLSGASSVANYQSALRSVSYFNGSDDPSALARTVSFVVGDGTLSSSVASKTVNVVAVNDAPVVSTSAGSTAYVENQAATPIDGALTLSDLDDATLLGATVTLSANFTAGQDVLGFINQNGISGSFDAGSGVLTLSGSASIADYQAALRSVSYFNSSDDPSSLARTVSFVVNDGALSSGIATRPINVTAVNDAPIVSTSAGSTAYVENQAALPIDGALTLADLDDATLSGATVTISTNYVAGQDLLDFVDQNGISESFDAATGVLSLSGSSSVANYQAALRSVSYFNRSDDPSALARTVSFVVSDGALSSSVASKTINVVAINDAPIVSTNAGSTAYVENQAATPIDGALTLSDLDNTTLASATIRVGSNFVAGQDVLGFTNQNGISGSFDAGSGVLTLSGSASLADYQAALRSVSYMNSSDDPSTLARTVSFVVSDGALDSAAATRSVLVTPVNDAPMLSTSSVSLAYAENQPATAVDPMLSLVDLDNATLVGATVAFSTNYVAGQDLLGFADQHGISGSFDAATGVLTLSGSSSVANYQAALRSVSYFNSSDDPSTLARTVSFVVNDGTLDSAAATRSVLVTPVNDAPVVSTSSGSLIYLENQPASVIDAALLLVDPDHADLVGATVQISVNFAPDEDQLVFVDQNGIDGNWDPTSATLTLRGTSSIANYQQALRSVAYMNRSDDPSSLERTVAIRVDDGKQRSDVASRTIRVSPSDDAPLIVTSPTAMTFVEKQAPTAIDPSLRVFDPDSGSLVGATVMMAANHFESEDVLSFVDQNGITGIWNAVSGVLTLSGSSSIANYQTALRSVSYHNLSADPHTMPRTIRFSVDDGSSSSQPATRLITPTAVNDAPTTRPVVLAAIEEDSGPRRITQAELLLHAQDPDSSALVASELAISSGRGTLVDQRDGSWTFTPDPDDDTALSFSYRISDGNLHVAGSAQLDITSVDDAPLMNLAPLTVQGGRGVLINSQLLQASDTDNEAATLRFVVLEVENGRFESLDQPGIAIVEFSQAQVNGGRVVFVSTSALDQPRFRIASFDGQSYSAEFSAVIDFRRTVLSASGGAATPLPIDLPAPTPTQTTGISAGNTSFGGDAGPTTDHETGLPQAGSKKALAASEALPRGAQPAAELIGEALSGIESSTAGNRVAVGSAMPRRASGDSNNDFSVRISADDYLVAMADFEMVLDPNLQVRNGGASGLHSDVSNADQGSDDAGSGGLTLSDAARVSGLALTAGTVWWALRAGSLLTGLMVSLPAWRHADLLAVLPDEEEDDAWDLAEDNESARDEHAVDLVFENDADGKR